MKEQKRAQAAIEFLATYGWAFLIILIAIGALSYFGVLSPSKLLPDRCNFGAEFGCVDYAIDSNGFNLKLRSSAGQPIVVDAITISSEKSQLSCTSSVDAAPWKSGEVRTISSVCADFANSGLIQGDKGKLNLKVSYHPAKSSASFGKEANGELYSTVKSDLSPSTGLVGFWTFNEGFGTAALDSSGKGNNGNIINGPSWTDGKKSNALSFNGVSNYLEIPDNPSIDPSSSITVMAWVKSSASTYNVPWSIVSKYYAYILGSDGGWSSSTRNMCFIIYTASGWQYGSCYSPSDITQWHHFAGTYDSATGEKKLYADGVLQSTTTPGGTIAPDSGPLDIGQRECCPGQVFNGLIDEVKIFNRALTATEVLAEYSG